MNILHITLGLPCYRNGGLIRYAYDLAKAETDIGHNVYILYPGNVGVINKKIRIVHKKDSCLNIFKLVNPLYIPVPLGIEDPSELILQGDKRVYSEFIDMVNPDIVHIHTFMGFHEELFMAISERDIRTIYSTHDYYLLCPKTSFLRNNELCVEKNGINCAMCNANCRNSRALQFVLQSEWYSRIKNNSIIKKLKHNGKKRKEIVSNNETSLEIDKKIIDKFDKYLIKQKGLIEYIDCFHFNSTITRSIYKPYIMGKDCFVRSITIAGLKDNRNVERKRRRNNKTVVGYIGINAYHKGNWLLQEAVQLLADKGYNIEAHFWGDEFLIDCEKYPNCFEEGNFSHDQLEDVMKNMDILVVPGFGYETFGFTAVEGIANNVLVLVSNRVGSKDVFNGLSSKHFFEPNVNSLDKLLEEYTISYDKYYEAVCEQKKIKFDFSIDEHAKWMIEKYIDIIQN